MALPRIRSTVYSFASLVSLLAGTAVSPVHSQGSTTPPGWRLVWSDEFNGPRLDQKKWNVLLREQSKHNELQYYVPDEAFVEGGMLRLRSRVRSYGGMKYTSGRVSTDGRFAPTYGRFEIRARLPGGKGLWPAHWLYPQNRNWAMEEVMQKAVDEKRERAIPEARPWYSEIDIMEFLGHETSTYYGTLHYRTFAGERKTSSTTWKADFDFTKEFHVFALEWEPDAIRWYVDGKLLHTTVNGVPHAPHYLILNTAVGGDWPGNPDSSTVFPQFHDIDYVRVFQRERPYF
jgi:beta-glucanase (GH16 family)